MMLSNQFLLYDSNEVTNSLILTQNIMQLFDNNFLVISLEIVDNSEGILWADYFVVLGIDEYGWDLAGDWLV